MRFHGMCMSDLRPALAVFDRATLEELAFLLHDLRALSDNRNCSATHHNAQWSDFHRLPRVRLYSALHNTMNNQHGRSE